MLTGYEQVRSIIADIDGDRAAAERVELALPETGVCNLRPAASPGQECCGGPAQQDAAACCAADEAAKRKGATGCGCG
jgi:hypothetical protein